jgi:hypothetical protein
MTNARSEVPFDPTLVDYAFVDRRWEQRRGLCMVPDWMVDDACNPRNGDVRPRSPLVGFDVVFMERHLRDLADEIAEGLDATLNELRSASIAEAALRLYEDLDWHLDAESPPQLLAPFVADKKAAAASEARKKYGHRAEKPRRDDRARAWARRCNRCRPDSVSCAG